jgi:hypothetical protein
LSDSDITNSSELFDFLNSILPNLGQPHFLDEEQEVNKIKKQKTVTLINGFMTGKR